MNGEGLRQRRKVLRLSQERLARELEVSRQAIYLWETGKSQAHWRVLELAMDSLAGEHGWEWHDWQKALKDTVIDDAQIGD